MEGMTKGEVIAHLSMDVHLLQTKNDKLRAERGELWKHIDIVECDATDFETRLRKLQKAAEWFVECKQMCIMQTKCYGRGCNSMGNVVENGLNWHMYNNATDSLKEIRQQAYTKFKELVEVDNE